MATPPRNPYRSAATRRLAPLLDPTAIVAIAQKLWTVRNRLHLHTQGNLPSAVEVAVALRLYMERCDNERLAISQSPNSIPHPRRSRDAPSIRLLHRLLSISDATYFVCEQHLLVTTLARLRLPPPVKTFAQAEKWKPGYVLVHDRNNSVLLLSIRGSRDVGDLLTNLSSDYEPFLNGFAHEGVVKSAHNLHRSLRRVLAVELARVQPRNGLVIVGHSLGGAAAAALTMLLRCSRAPRDEPITATSQLASARCFSFAPPPFLCPALAARSRRMPIITVAYGLDVVPRLSAASVDRLLHRLSAYDFSPHVSSAVSKIVRSVTAPVIGEREAASLADRAASVKVNADVLANFSGSLANIADRALSSRGAGPNGAAGGMWGTALNAVLFATRVMGSEVQGNANRLVGRRDTGGHSFAREVNRSDADAVDRALDGTPEDMFLAGEIWHVDRPFVEPTADVASRGDWPVPSIVRRDASFFSDIEVSAWMLYDHNPHVIAEDLKRMQRGV